MTQPLVGAVLAASLSALFLLLTASAQYLRMDRISQQQTDTLAALSGPLMASGEIQPLIDRLENVSGGRFLLIDVSGVIIGGDPSLADQRGTKSADLAADDETVGKLLTYRLQPFEFMAPAELIVGLVFLSLGTAYVVGRFYTRFVLSGLASIERAFLKPESPDEDELDQSFTFTEFTRLRLHAERRMREVFRTETLLRQAAFENPESGLPNLRAFTQAVNDALARADFENPLCVISLEVDHFQTVSDQLGVEGTETLVKQIRERITGELLALETLGRLQQRDCVLAHFQADEFGLLLPLGTGRDLAALVTRNLRRAFVAPFNIGFHRVILGLSGGMAIAPEDGDRIGNLLHRAQSALKSQRKEGKEGFVFYQARLDRTRDQRILLEADIRMALDEDAFWPAFQPKIELQSGRIRGCEALARWTRHDGSAVPPNAFIPVAEQTGMIVEIGETILRKSCLAAAGWVREGWHVPVAVNVSAAQLDDPTFCDRVLNAIAEAGLPPRLLELEMTESMAVRDPARVEAVLKPLRRMGVRLAIDDFGTGHANLAIITRLNFDVFKIDRSFVSGLPEDTSRCAVIDMILAMAHSMDHDTVAEGVETPAQHAYLRDRGCTYAQGYHFSRAVGDAEFRDLLRNWAPLVIKDEQRLRA